MLRSILVALLLFVPGAPLFAQFKMMETEHLRLVYLEVASEFLARHAASSFENSLAFHHGLFGFTPSEKVTVFLHDLDDYGNAGADVLPRDRITLGMAPLNYVFETAPANERINSTMHHEMMHLVANDKAARRDRVFRTLFAGKVAANADDPLSIFYSYLTAPRRYAPRWYQEGIAVFMETWMSGGLGRSLGGYDEMVFRTLVHDGAPLYGMVGLESEGRDVDFQVGVNSYLYGTRFMSYLAYRYGPERVVAWVSRTPGSKAHFTSAFKATFGLPITRAWDEWIELEHGFQRDNLDRIRAFPTTPYRPLSRRVLGSVSRIHYDEARGKLFAAVNFPGQIAHLVAIDLDDGAMERIIDVKGANLYAVSSLAYDPDTGTLFYTTDNNAWRDLRAVDLATRKGRTLLKDARVGDIAFNPADRSLWGVRHYLGFSTLVRIPYPYDEWNQVYVWPYGRDLYDIDVSPDGRYLSGALAEVSGRQTLVRMETEKLLAGDHAYDTLFDFEVSNPEGFSFSPDGRYLYGSSYYSGVSNIYRYDLEAGRMQVMSNAETGFFRPVPISGNSLVALRYTAQGFEPVLIPDRPAGRVGAIAFFGQRVVEEHPVVQTWMAGSPAAVALDSLLTYEGPYRSLRHVRPASAYPVVQGYKDYVGVGLRLDLADDVGFHHLNLSAAYTPATALPADERWHAGLRYTHLRWTVTGAYNGADFYDLFGPTKTSRKGYSVGVQYEERLINDRPRFLDYRIQVAGYGGLERLPDYQNVAASAGELLTARASLSYENLRMSIGGVDKEKGVQWSLNGAANYVRRRVFPRLYAAFDAGAPLPIDHASLWLRASAGQSFGDRDDPFANFFFGGFGNNWIDYQDEKRYHAYYSFPGVELNALGGANFGRALVELNLPPLRFRRVGGASLFLKWARLSLFTAGLVTDFDSPARRSTALNAGGQVDFRIMLFSYLSTTFSLGYAVADEGGEGLRDEFMISLKIL